MPTVLLASRGPLLIVLHALAAIALCGASVHHAVIATLALRKKPLRVRLAKLYSLVALCGYVVTLTTGALVYPRYRYFVRGLYLDRYAPWATNLFDFKENLATIGLPLAVGAFIVARALLPESPEAGQAAPSTPPATYLLYGLFALGTSVISVFNLIAGLICTSVRGI